MELFPCQTCSTSYHANCMVPSLTSSDVPSFWFCPHCVDNELHIPPGSPRSDYITPVSLPVPQGSVYSSPISPFGSQVQQTNPVPQTPGISRHDHCIERSLSHRPLANEEKLNGKRALEVSRNDTNSASNAQKDDTQAPTKARQSKEVGNRPRKSYSAP